MTQQKGKPMNYYIVLSDDGTPLQLSRGGYVDTPKYGALFGGSYATLFPNRKAAKRAIKRSVLWRSAWGANESDYEIVRVKEGLAP